MSTQMTGQNWPDGVAAKGRAQWGQIVYEVAFQFHTINEVLKILKQLWLQIYIYGQINFTMLRLSYYTPKMWGHRQQWISHKMNMYSAPRTIEKMKILGAILELPANSTANPAHLPQNWAKLVKSAVLISWQLKKGSQNVDFFQLPWVPMVDFM